MGVTITSVDPGNAAAIDLLSRSSLLTTDIDSSISTFFGATESGALVGVIGLERRGRFGLVRSMAVEEAARRRGIARQLYDQVEAEASARGLYGLYALTENAEPFFRAAGFVQADRRDAPPEIAASPQFAALCPTSAALLVRFFT